MKFNSFVTHAIFVKISHFIKETKPQKEQLNTKFSNSFPTEKAEAFFQQLKSQINSDRYIRYRGLS